MCHPDRLGLTFSNVYKILIGFEGEKGKMRNNCTGSSYEPVGEQTKDQNESRLLHNYSGFGSMSLSVWDDIVYVIIGQGL